MDCNKKEREKSVLLTDQSLTMTLQASVAVCSHAFILSHQAMPTGHTKGNTLLRGLIDLIKLRKEKKELLTCYSVKEKNKEIK
jgi:hypothetical protein